MFRLEKTIPPLLLIAAACGDAGRALEESESEIFATMVATSTVVDPSCRTNIWCSGHNANTITECEQQAPVDCSYFCNQSTGCGPTASCSLGQEDHRGKRLEGLDGGDTCVEAYTSCNIIPAPRGSRWLVFNFVCECTW